MAGKREYLLMEEYSMLGVYHHHSFSINNHHHDDHDDHLVVQQVSVSGGCVKQQVFS